MTERARKPDEAPTSISQRVGKAADALPVDDPSIPVLTERLTLPPLDLDLDFRLPPAPPAGGTPPQPEAPEEPSPEASIDAAIDAAMDGAIEAPLEAAAESSLAPQVAPASAAPAAAPSAPLANEEPPGEPVTVLGAANPDLEPTLLAPRVPSSLLAANVLARSEKPAAPVVREDELTGSGAWGPGRMETDLREMILLGLARRLPTEVEAIVRRYLESAIDQAMARFAAEARIALAATLREMVDRAIKAELERIKSTRR